MEEILLQVETVLTYGGIVLAVFVILLLRSKSVQRSRANLFLSILLAALAFSVAHTLFAGRIVSHLSARVYSMGDPSYLLIAPLLWLYSTELTGHRLRWSPRLLVHFLPFLLIIIFSLTFQSIPEGRLYYFLVQNHRWMYVFFWLLMVVQFSAYQYMVHQNWQLYRQLIRQEVSNTEDLSIGWIRFFLRIFLIINLFFLFSLVVAVHAENGLWLFRTKALLFSISIFALGYKGILQRQLIVLQPIVQGAEETPSGGTDNCAPASELLDQLGVFMREKRPYLEPDLSLGELARQSGIGRSQLSQLINSTGSNFYDFINKYRIEEVKRLMADPAKQNYSLLGMALEAGFKSKSTFNEVFKRFTGLTPKEYRQNLLQ